MTSRWSDDDQLMADLAEALRSAGSVPPEVVSAAKAVFDLRTLDAELAQLTYDSRLDPELVGAMRADKLSVRSLVFGMGELNLDVDVLPDALVGQVTPVQEGRVSLESRDGRSVEADIDDTGMFSVAWTGSGEVRLHVHLATGSSFVTEWTRI